MTDNTDKKSNNTSKKIIINEFEYTFKKLCLMLVKRAKDKKYALLISMLDGLVLNLITQLKKMMSTAQQNNYTFDVWVQKLHKELLDNLKKLSVTPQPTEVCAKALAQDPMSCADIITQAKILNAPFIIVGYVEKYRSLVKILVLSKLIDSSYGLYFDVDGTCKNIEKYQGGSIKRIGPLFRDTMRLLDNLIAINTGRNFLPTRYTLSDMGVKNYAYICENGGLAGYKIGKKVDMLMEQVFKKDDKGKTVFDFESTEYYHGPYYKHQLKANVRYAHEWLSRGSLNERYDIRPCFERITDICAQLPHKPGIGQNDEKNIKWIKRLQDWLNLHNLSHFTATTTSTPHFHIHLADITKATGMTLLNKKIKKFIKIDKKIVFGNANNDAPMFKIADYKIAPVNATEEIKKLASHVATQPGTMGLINQMYDIILKPAKIKKDS